MPSSPGPLTFTRYDMMEAGSAAALFAGSTEVCGIYVLEFEDEMRYVGQTRQIVARYSAHRRRRGDIVALSFAPCPITDLDECERREIRRQESAHSLRNLNLTGWPAGRGDLDVTVEDGTSIFLPWERERRVRLGDGHEGGDTTMQRRFWDLAARPDYEEMADALARYVDECIPDPFGTQRVLWTIVASPSTSRTAEDRRLFTLSCGGRETLFAREYVKGRSSRVEICMNVDGDRVRESRPASSVRDIVELFSMRTETVPYGNEIISRSVVRSWRQLERVLARSHFAEGAYRLNTTQMRRRSSPYRRHHNQAFADDILRRAAARSRRTS
ncbi:GIY-YIG nuclease family protein [Clavibacter lycopersici]|uniref:GIY-YIG nuclease family protein n=1 Tax=Clavibacter lycopersici TaxID=2301718 RepID=A0A399TE73_9MICO|nr:GIY-YIG nuclease family protein [Clavibacter lycopersici]RIJ52283.1 GIY-YIG nuclease family protein [Clavibacter lycopersici]RIJ62525.1 GIY-YIG nuclease family protein [Clavibacter lycopersici]